MKGKWLIGLLPAIAIAPLATANITDWHAADDGDGAIVCVAAWNSATYELSVDGIQHWHPGHLLGDFVTDTEEDPLVWVRNTVTNDADVLPLVWTDYHINLTMDKPFDIIAAATMPGWSYSYTPHASSSGPGQWLGTIDYVMDTGGSPVNVGQDGEFDYKISFAGTIHYCQEMIPTPEPATLALLLAGAVLALRRHP